MTATGDRQPSSLHEGFQNDYWVGGLMEGLSNTQPGILMEHIITDVDTQQVCMQFVTVQQE